jgi:outer membrane protein assembly factor BamB
MQRRIAWAGGLVLGIGLFIAGSKARAALSAPLPLSTIIKDNTFIFLTEVETIYPDKPALMLKVGKQLKGKFPFSKVPINLTGDSDAKKNNYTAKLRKRLAPKLPVLVLISLRVEEDYTRYTLFAFTNGTWFQVVGKKIGKSDRVRWSFTHCEPYLRRTFAGTTVQLQQIVSDFLAGKGKPPPLNPKEKPGLGPEVKEEKKARREFVPRSHALRGNACLDAPRPEQSSPASLHPAMQSVRAWVPTQSVGTRKIGGRNSGLPFAVIPTLGLGGPLAILAMLFPGLFGGALLVFRNWIALLTVASVNSTLLFVYLWFGRSLEDTWLGQPLGLWFTMTLITLAGTFWSWRRQIRSLAAGTPTAEKPTRSEQVILWISSLAFLGSFLVCWFGTLDMNDPTWKLLLVFAVGFGAGTLYVFYRALLRAPRPGLPSEGIILGSMIVASTCLAATWPAPTAPTATHFEKGSQRPVTQQWCFVPPNRTGFIVSSCLVHEDRVYVAAALRQGAETFGALYCLDAGTGSMVWKFDDTGDMKQVFSSPCLADGRLFIGEGFHQDKSCKLYCLDARTGKKLWAFETESHTESSPCVAAGKVFFGAGDDGVYCFTTKGKKVWQYPGKDGNTTPTVGIPPGEKVKWQRRLKLHVDADPVVVGKYLYVGSGIDRDASEPCDPAVFCLNVETGKKVWLKPLLRQDLPAWGSPAATGDQVFFGLGNGDIMQDAPEEKPAGALLCVSAATGKELWRYPVANGVLKKPLVDRDHVCFGSRDGHCYCLERQTGKLRWKNDLQSPIVASPALFRCPHCGTQRLYVLGSKGRVRCFDPDTGLVHWTNDLGEATFLSSSPRVAVSRTGNGEHRRLYFGAGLDKLSGMPGVYCLEDQ